MDEFQQTLAVEAATIDELLSDEFEPLPGRKADAERAGARLGAWCKAAASGDWSLFERRLARDGGGLREALARFATVRRKASAPLPAWVSDAVWIEAALASTLPGEGGARDDEPYDDKPCDDKRWVSAPIAFEDALLPLTDRASGILLAACGEAANILAPAALACLRDSLLKELSDLLAPALYERFAKARMASPALPGPAARPGRATYERFIAELRDGGYRGLFREKPVLLRLIAVLTRQWIETSCELVVRLAADAPTIGRTLLHADRVRRVAAIEDRLSDPHNGGRTVKIVTFSDGAKVVYKPKALQLDVALHALIARLNGADAPIDLRAAAVIAREGYGWAEHVAHADCARREDLALFFRRSGAWLALLHGLVGVDMHHENIVAVGDHPVPIDLEMLLQPSPDEHRARDAEDQALAAAMDQVANSVVAVGLLPAYARSPDKNIVPIGGIEAQRGPKPTLAWEHVNCDGMRPIRACESDDAAPNMPRAGGAYAAFGDYVDDFVAGFEAYARFLGQRVRADGARWLLDGFAGARVRKVARPTRFYDMLLRRLKDHRTMTDGVTWSAQADFAARLSDWDDDSDPLWPLGRAERAALTDLDVPYFIIPSDGTALEGGAGFRLETAASPGIERARRRLGGLDDAAIAAESEIIRQTTTMAVRAARPATRRAAPPVPRDAQPLRRDDLIEQGDRAADALLRHAIQRVGCAAWIGLDWFGDSEVGQLVALGVDLYNGNGGIALFLAAHAAVTANAASETLARAALAHVRKALRGRNAARLGRVIGLGAGTGLGSVIYALSCVADFLRDERYIDDARAAARLIGDDLIAADRQLDALGGAAGAILALLRLHRQCCDDFLLERAEACGHHLLAQPRIGVGDHVSWAVEGAGRNPLNGMSHGAAGFALALSSLAAATGKDEFAAAAAQCLAFENASYDAERHNWPDLRHRDAPSWPSKWCHGAYGIGLARIAMARASSAAAPALAHDIRAAVAGAASGWPGRDDTLCCGALGHVEFLCEAGAYLERPDLCALGASRMTQLMANAARTGGYRWNGGIERFNLGLFRGVAGAGYAAMRRIDPALPNVLVWQ